jgi:hypothetical protein
MIAKILRAAYNSFIEERGSQAVLGSSTAAIVQPPRSALPAFSEE